MKKALTIVTTETDPYKQLGWYDFNLFDGQKLDIIFVVNDNYKTYVQQKIDKSLNKGNTEDVSISGVFKKEYNDFCSELKKYCLDTLNSFHDACQSCIDILILRLFLGDFRRCKRFSGIVTHFCLLGAKFKGF